MSSLYGTFTIEEADAVGKKFRVVCTGNRGMERFLTNGKEYVVTITPRILPTDPLCSFTGDTGKQCEAHLHRFDKVEEVA